MTKRALSNRAVLVIVCTITVVLLFGSLILQNIYFKADQVASSIYLSPTTFSVQPQGSLSLSIKADLAGEAEVLGSQFTLSYDPTLLQFSGTQASSNWRTVKVLLTDGKVTWAMIPEDNQGISLPIKTTTTLGIVQFQALKAGRASITIDQQKSSLSAIDSAQSPPFYNAITSVQDSSGLISPSGAPTVVPDVPAILSESTNQSDSFSSQRIISTDAVSASSSSRILIQTKYLGLAAIEFGATPQVSSTLEGTEVTTNHSLQLSGLESNTRYYYRVVAYSPDKKSAIRSQLRSFTTTPAASGTVPTNESLLKIFPENAKDSAQIVVGLRDAKQSSVDLPVEYQVLDGRATVKAESSQAGLALATLKSSATTKQTVTIVATSGGVEIGRAKAEFDPALASFSAPNYSPSVNLPLNRTVMLLLFGSCMGMLLFGLIFLRLAKVK